ncbi:MAG: ATP-binding protein [Actinomycetota bacterium]|nr:ATP-binding protein [Actinomycetota bacterium]
MQWLRRPDGIEHLLLIVDACFAGGIANDTIHFDKQLPKSWLILPSASRDGTAQVGALTTAISNAIAKLRSGEGEKYGINRPYFRVSDFLDTVREGLTGQTLDPLYRGQYNAEHICLPNPHYATQPDAVPTERGRRELALSTADLANHWVPRARGIAGPESTGATVGEEDTRWLFTGRANLVRELIGLVDPSTRDTDGLSSTVTLVTGGAGCGKSAVLARLVTLSDPEFLRAYTHQLTDVPGELRPAPGAIDVAVLATGKYPHEVLAQILAVITDKHSDNTPAVTDLDALVEACRAQIGRRRDAGQPTTVVLDALDESEQPLRIAQALHRLIETAGLRLLVGVRSPAGPEDPLAATGPAGPLADQVEQLFGARRLRVDQDPWWCQDDITRYAASILRHNSTSLYSSHGELAEQLAQVISDRVGRSFLVARLAATALTQRMDLVDPNDSAWHATLDEGIVGVFRADLTRLFPDLHRRLDTVELLRAVAFAFGRGLPWGDIWPLVANAVADRHAKFGDRDIAELLASPISAYLITDQEDDTTVYRLFHDALRGTLRDRWHELLTP